MKNTESFTARKSALKNLLLSGLLITQANIQAAPSQNFEHDLNAAAIERTTHSVTYNGAYVAIPYPNGDVPQNTGVCTDVIVRAYRAIGADLQQLVHEDMAAHFSLYPSKQIWGLTRPDKNIDHRRVPNLQTFFTRHGSTLTISNNAQDYQTGDIVTWKLPGNLPHIGIVTQRTSPATGNPLIAHNIGQGPKLDDMLFDYPITGHYRYLPQRYQSTNSSP
ncbi:DUF1287 domain-containing protein [Marinagarivorans cellulosilyticus]|uniref:DUF1287 domain-containing protein n=1 Tax=Marinagarivorans cellulosilyticus TaxID=2721545 RepID=A0AAN2BKP9_9GAMM|nr:DUF1287 domain-containing protein [Marinagarivorans cellulosilyticus]BCD98190.1 hypothetical protein MARGE09_P2391 [Marinagarivorans cellulosilyticus]